MTKLSRKRLNSMDRQAMFSQSRKVLLFFFPNLVHYWPAGWVSIYIIWPSKAKEKKWKMIIDSFKLNSFFFLSIFSFFFFLKFRCTVKSQIYGWIVIKKTSTNVIQMKTFDWRHREPIQNKQMNKWKEIAILIKGIINNA